MKIINVTAAVLEKGGRILIARRKKGDHQEGKWELPGGTIEENELPEECLKRELLEEFGIETQVREFIMENVHEYRDKTIRLMAYRVRHVSGDFILREHEQIAWLTAGEMESYSFAEADIPILQRLAPANGVKKS